MPELDDLKRELFCNEYLVDLCGAAAARRAQYAPNRAKQTAWELLRMPDIRARIKELIAEREENSPIRKYRAVEELAALACSSVEHYEVDKKGRLKIAKGAPNRAMAAVKMFKQRTRTIPQGKDATGNQLPDIVERETELRLHDKNPALHSYLEHVGAIQPKNMGVTVNVGVTAVVDLTPEERLARLRALKIPATALPAPVATTDASNN